MKIGNNEVRAYLLAMLSIHACTQGPSLSKIYS